jgi:DNA-binding GntR family transcriptional regulator
MAIRPGNLGFVRCRPMSTPAGTDLDSALDPGLDPTTSSVAPSEQSRGEAAYRTIKHRLLLGEFAFGQRLAEERLAAMLDVSRTPIRVALVRLHAEGHVQRHPDGGFEPTFPDLDRIAQLYEVRTSLELTSVQRRADGDQSAGTHDRAALLELRRDWLELGHRADAHADPDFVLVDEDFHVRLALASGNDALAEVLASVNERIRIVRIHDFLTEERIRATVDEHVGIVDDLLEGAVDVAAARLRAHIDESARIASERAWGSMVRMLAGRSRSRFHG